MRTYSVNRLKVLSVHYETSKFVFIKLKSEKNTKANVVDSALHGSVHSFCVIIVIVLRPRRMKLEIALFMVGFLKQNIGSYSCFL